jgi:flagellar hook assembly protein FlgD
MASQPYPNPFWPARGGRSSIDVYVNTAGTVTIKAFTLSGVLVREIANQECENGKNTFSWDGRNSSGDLVATGMYFVIVDAPGLNQQRLVGVLK